MLRKTIVTFLLGAVPAGCAVARGSFEPLTPDHPASARADEAPVLIPKERLAHETPAPGRAPHGEAMQDMHSAPTQVGHPGHEKAPPPSSGGESSSYVCPMHPDVRSPEPGRCPRCGMKLVAKQQDERPSEDRHEHP